MRLLAALVVLLLSSVTASPAAAAGASVTVANMAFGPGKVSVALGERVTWTFSDSVAHTTTSDQGLWDSGTRSGGATYSRAFTSAGTFAYHCTLHPHMHGKVAVSLKATGSPSDGWKLRWATRVGRLTFDVQVRRGSGPWRSLLSGTSKAAQRFEPARAGSYSVRARTVKGGERSGWSPATTLPIS